MQTTTHTVTDFSEIVIDAAGTYIIDLVKEGAQANIVGKFLVEHKDRLSVEVFVHHKARHTRCDTTLKGVARDSAHIRFVGRIVIDPDCGASNSFLTERILLLSQNATAEAVPELEILTDDVKCSHAASVSMIPESQVFYLQSRGLARVAAENLIVEGFLE